LAFIIIVLLTTIGISGNISPQNDVEIFRICLGLLLGLIAIVQLYLAAVLIKNRMNPLLELSQPIPLSLFAICGGISTLVCFLFALPEYDVSCAIRQPIIFVCLTIMGSILVGKSWRISCILSPTTLFAAASDSTNRKDKIQLVRINIMNGLSKLSRIKCSMNRCKDRSRRLDRRSSIRCQVTLADMMRVTSILVIPQLILQIINLSLPSVRMQSIEMDGIHMCHSDIGYWFLLPSVVLALTPFFMALIVNIKSQSRMPDVLREYNQILNSMKVSTGVLCITLPTIAMLSQSVTNVYSYLMSSSLLSFVLPLCHSICWKKIRIIRKNTTGKRQSIQRATSGLPTSTSSSTDSSDGDSLETLQSAEEAAAMGQMYQNMGNTKKAIQVDFDILSMFKEDGEFLPEEGFKTTEIRRLGPKTLQVVVSTLIVNAKHWNACIHKCKGEEKDNCIRQSTKSCLDALSIFEMSPARLKLKDRSIVFPGYSYMAALIKSGDVHAPNGMTLAEFQSDLSNRFMKETQFALYHHCRSLSLKADFCGLNQQFDEALGVIEEIKHIYNAPLHSKAIADEYSLDHPGIFISISALWLLYLERQEEALAVCNSVVDTILPEFDGKDLLGLTLLLVPIIKVLLKTQGCEGASRARELFQKHVFEPGRNKESHAKSVMQPLMVLLTCCSTDIESDFLGMEDDIEWILNGEEKIVDWTDTVFTKHANWNIYSILAEACLCLAKRLDSGNEKQRALLEEGIRLSELAEPKMKNNEGDVTLPIAYSFHVDVLSELKCLIVPV